MESYKVSQAVTPAKAGVYNELKTLDPRLRDCVITCRMKFNYFAP